MSDVQQKQKYYSYRFYFKDGTWEDVYGVQLLPNGLIDWSTAPAGALRLVSGHVRKARISRKGTLI